ncbi:hypothetical protein ACI65C_009037 [Semiaphis heraclei]
MSFRLRAVAAEYGPTLFGGKKNIVLHPPPPDGRDHIAYPWKPAGASGVATRQLRRHIFSVLEKL